MLDHLKSILPRVQQYSKHLDDTASFADIPWTFFDTEGEKVTYIFRRNQDLLVSKKGDVLTGKWEYLPIMQSLLIEYDGKKSLYNQGFLDKAVMILRKDSTDELFPMINPAKVHNSDLVGYLESVYNSAKPVIDTNASIPEAEKVKSVKMTLKNGEIVVISSEKGVTTSFIGCEIRKEITGEILPDGWYENRKAYAYKVKSGMIEDMKDVWFNRGIWVVLLVIVLVFISIFIYSNYV
jgi:hypothetical protein